MSANKRGFTKAWNYHTSITKSYTLVKSTKVRYWQNMLHTTILRSIQEEGVYTTRTVQVRNFILPLRLSESGILHVDKTCSHDSALDPSGERVFT